MIDFELTDDHRALVQTVKEFGQKEVAPFIKEWDEKQEYQPEILKKMGNSICSAFVFPNNMAGLASITSRSD